MNLIVAVDNKWGIGRAGGLLANIPGDMKYFREMTMGKVVVMGRRTLESMPGRKGLPGRSNIVLTSNPSYEAEDCTVVNSEDELFAELEKYDPEEVFLIGGAAIYNKYYKLCNKLYVTKIDADLSADTFIINYDEDPDFVITSESDSVTENGISYKFATYEKRN